MDSEYPSILNGCKSVSAVLSLIAFKKKTGISMEEEAEEEEVEKGKKYWGRSFAISTNEGREGKGGGLGKG